MGQAGQGGITGLVTDASGAVVPTATVQIVNEASGVERETRTTSAGLYAFPGLIPGTYRLTTSAQGFQKVVQGAITVEVDRTTEINVALKPGTVSETLNIVANVQLVDTTSSTVGQLISAKALESMPLNGRDVYLLVQLSPGVIPVDGALNYTAAWNRPGVEVSSMTINGQVAGGVAYYLDGTPLTVEGYGSAATSPAFTPPLDLIQEYRMETNNFPANVASPGTGVISLASRSGTNSFHGSGFTFLRPNALASNDPFLKASQLESGQPNKPPDFHRYQWGASIGGPIRKDKLFFFGDYEGTQQRTLSTLTTTVPTIQEKMGDFSQIPTIYNPFNVSADGHRQPFPGNIIPPGMLNPVALAMDKLIPAPNQPGTGPYLANNYFDGSLIPNDAEKFDIRLDSVVSSKHQLFGRYSFARFTTGTADHYHNAADPLYYFSLTRGQNVLIADNYTPGANTVLQFRYSFTRHAEAEPVLGAAKNFDLTSVGFPASLTEHQVARDIPYMNIAGMYGVGSYPWATAFKYISMNHDVSVAADSVKGRHDLKFGFDYRKSFLNQQNLTSPSGYYVFDNTATSSSTFAGNGQGFASYMLGMGSPFESQPAWTIDPLAAQSSPYYGSYFTDDVRISSKLTVNLGLRWEIFGGRTDRFNQLEYFDSTVKYTVNGVSMTGGEVFVGKGHRSPFTTNLRDFGPRFGFAYQPASHAVIHGGFGIFHGPSLHSVGSSLENSDGFGATTSWVAIRYDQFGNSVMLNPLNNPFPAGVVLPTKGVNGPATNLGSILSTAWQSQPTPTAYNWNLGVQYELPHQYIISAGWVGSRGLHQVVSGDLNQLSLTQIGQYGSSLLNQVPNLYLNAITNPAAPFYHQPTIPNWQALAAYPQFATGAPGSGVALNWDALGDSIYHSLQTKVEKRVAKHFSTLASFTFGKLISDASGSYNYLGQHAGYQDWRNRSLDRALDPQDVSRWFTWALTYDLPVGRGRALNTENKIVNAIVGGWSVNTLFSWGTGVPIIVSGSFPNQSQFFSQRPDLVCDAAKGAPRTAQQWFLPNCFAVPASPYVPGNAPRTLPDMRADGTHNLDASIFKNFPFGEQRNVQFRAEFFNFTNSVQLGLPNATWTPVDLSTFGAVTYASSSPRQVQFAVRLTF
jgi:hypothetical protein